MQCKLLTQAIKNLVENAIKYSSESTTVTITSDEDNGHINIHVSDEGPGIDESICPNYFNDFIVWTPLEVDKWVVQDWSCNCKTHIASAWWSCKCNKQGWVRYPIYSFNSKINYKE